MYRFEVHFNGHDSNIASINFKTCKLVMSGLGTTVSLSVLLINN